jgi:enoyl-CoA hydratase/carnithine racemase
VSSTVLVEQPRKGVTRLVLNRPEQLNAMTSEMIQALHDALDDLAVDGTCRVIVLTGTGKGFCAGLDLGGYGEAPGDHGGSAVHRGLATQRHIAGLVQRIRKQPQPVVAAVNGAAAGGGLALVCASDVRLASSSAVFAASFIRVGYSGCDIGVSWMLPRLLGAGRAHELMLTGRRFSADEALHFGLLADVVDPDELDARVELTVDQLLAAPPLSLELTKQGMWLAIEIPSFDAAVELENRQQILTSQTADQKEAMAAWLEKRPPEYQNR